MVRPLRMPGEALVADRGTHHLTRDDPDAPRIGVLALQGDVLEHLRALDASGACAVPVTRADALGDLDGIVIPGGESTTIGRLLVLYGLLEPLRDAITGGLPALGTCAGAILLGQKALHHDGRPADQPLLGAMATTVRRNAFGRQVASFEADLDVLGLVEPFHAVFIRAPRIEEAGDEVEVLATVPVGLPDDQTDGTDGRGASIVAARQGHVLACAFHPELSGDHRIHAEFVGVVTQRGPRS